MPGTEHTARFLSPLVTEYVRPGWSRVVHTLAYRSALTGDLIEVRPGFEFDWDSVPRTPFIHAMLKGRAEKAACVHDWLYCRQKYSRKVADRIFWEAMKAEGVQLRYRLLIYAGVRLGGWLAWRKHATNQSA